MLDLNRIKKKYKKECNYKITKFTKKLTREDLENYYENDESRLMMFTSIFEEIYFALKKDEIKSIGEIKDFLFPTWDLIDIPIK